MIGLVMEPRLGRRIPSPVYSAHNCQAWDYPASPRAAVSPSDGAPDLKASARVSSSSSCTFPWLNVAFRARPRHWARNLLGRRKTYRRAGMYEADRRGEASPPRTASSPSECRSSSRQDASGSAAQDRSKADRCRCRMDQLLVQVTQHSGHEDVDPAQQVALRDHVIEVELVEKARLGL